MQGKLQKKTEIKAITRVKIGRNKKLKQKAEASKSRGTSYWMHSALEAGTVLAGKAFLQWCIVLHFLLFFPSRI